MSTARQRRRWADSDSPRAEPAPRVAVQITFRHIPTSPAVVERVEAEAQKLCRYFDRITHCHVVIVAPHRHHRHGRHYTIHLELGVPGERLVIAHEPAPHPQDDPRHGTKTGELQAQHKDVYVVIREVFDVARRRLEDYARRVRGDVKRHRATD